MIYHPVLHSKSIRLFNMRYSLVPLSRLKGLCHLVVMVTDLQPSNDSFLAKEITALDFLARITQM